ncbi:MAG: type III pantothenate kinase [Cyclobacteriaceae bacterium]|nr:type III pantothenate kinase [Cyclobacteriaceae bacterium]
MNLTVDYGNSRIKIGLFEANNLNATHSFEVETMFFDWVNTQQIDNVIMSSVTIDALEVLKKIPCNGKKLVMDQSLSFPIAIHYKTPHTLGVDRIAAACGALDMFPQKDCLVIDMGSCINYEFIDANANYFGGAISPGVSMRFKAMHTFTARLPLIQPKKDPALTGQSTEDSMLSGVMNGIAAEVNGTIEKYKKKYPTLEVILCGGDAHFFENQLKQPIFVAPNLVLCGLNRILVHNVSL